MVILLFRRRRKNSLAETSTGVHNPKHHVARSNKKGFLGGPWAQACM